VGNVQRRPNGKWRARYRDPDGKEHAKHFERKADATRFLATVESSKLQGAFVDPTSKVTVAQYARQWASAQPHRAGTARGVEQTIRHHIEGTTLGSRRLVTVRSGHVQEWATDLTRKRGLARSTVGTHLRILRTIFNAAVRDKLIGTSPAKRIALPAAEVKHVVPLTVQQVRQLAVAVPPRFRAMVLTQAGLGLRLGEVAALRRQDVDFLRRTVRIEYQFANNTTERVPPKTRKSRRTIPLPAVVAEALAEHMRQHPTADDGSLFCGPRTRRPMVSTHYSTQAFKRAVRKLAAEPGSTFPVDTSTHDLRHHYASVLLAHGESVIVVAERLGHETANLVLNTYGHLMPDSEDRTRKAVDAAWSADDSGVFPIAAANRNADYMRTHEAP
jgi:integrase